MHWKQFGSGSGNIGETIRGTMRSLRGLEGPHSMQARSQGYRLSKRVLGQRELVGKMLIMVSLKLFAQIIDIYEATARGTSRNIIY